MPKRDIIAKASPYLLLLGVFLWAGCVPLSQVQHERAELLSALQRAREEQYAAERQARAAEERAAQLESAWFRALPPDTQAWIRWQRNLLERQQAERLAAEQAYGLPPEAILQGWGPQGVAPLWVQDEILRRQQAAGVK